MPVELVSSRRLPPSRSAVKISTFPSTDLAKARCRPSGAKLGLGLNEPGGTAGPGEGEVPAVGGEAGAGVDQPRGALRPFAAPADLGDVDARRAVEERGVG